MLLVAVTVWIAVAAFALTAGLQWAVRKRGDARRRACADVIREQLRREDAELRRSAALVAETEV